MTHPDLWDDIHRSTSIKVHRGEIQSFARDQVQFEGGSQIQADMVFSSNWLENKPFAVLEQRPTRLWTAMFHALRRQI
jgi:hypothetical protein